MLTAVSWHISANNHDCKMKKIFSLTLAVLLCTTIASARNITVVVKNTLWAIRKNETVELNAATIKKQVGKNIIVTYNNKQVPYQLTYNGKLIFQATVPAKGTASYVIKAGNAETFKSKVTGRMHPEREDDVAWENDLIAFRCYGPALQRSGEQAYGYDIWVKNTPNFVCDFRYGQEDMAKPILKAMRAAGKMKEAQHYEDSISYHIDHGHGLDFYDVGPTLGAGTTAFLENGKIIYPYCYTTEKILDNGPIRFTVRLTYPVIYKGVKMTETRILSLDAGSQLNKVIVSYTGQQVTLPVIAGIVLQDGSKDYDFSAAKGYAAYAGKIKKNGQIFVGMAFPNAVRSIKTLLMRSDETLAISRKCDGHIIALSYIAKGAKLTYYWGAAWNKYTVKDDKAWSSYMSNYARKVRTPLIVTVK
jgi:hypothetical protein